MATEKRKSNLTHEDRVRGGKASRAKYAYGKASTAAKKLDLAVKQTLSTLVEDVIAYNAREANGDDDNIKNRKNHLALLNQEINAIMKMRDLANVMRDEAAKEMKADVTENRANIRLIGEANKKLSEAGIAPPFTKDGSLK